VTGLLHDETAKVTSLRTCWIRFNRIFAEETHKERDRIFAEETQKERHFGLAG